MTSLCKWLRQSTLRNFISGDGPTWSLRFFFPPVMTYATSGANFAKEKQHLHADVSPFYRTQAPMAWRRDRLIQQSISKSCSPQHETKYLHCGRIVCDKFFREGIFKNKVTFHFLLHTLDQRICLEKWLEKGNSKIIITVNQLLFSNNSHFVMPNSVINTLNTYNLI